MLAVLCEGEIVLDQSEIASCGETFFFDTTSLSCQPCENGSTKTEEGTSCECNAGYRVSEGSSLLIPNPSCTLCPGASPASSRDRSECLVCGDGATYNQASRFCLCPRNQKVVETDVDGQLTATCEVCAEDAW